MVCIGKRFEVDASECRRLAGSERVLVQVPESVLTDKELGDKRITAMTYFLYFKNVVGNVNFSIDKMVSWIGKSPNRNKGKINDKFKEAVLNLADVGILNLCESPGNSVCTSAVVDMEKVSGMCDTEHYAVMYFDEIENIVSYRNEDRFDRYMDNETVLMVFAYLRSNIRLRRNELFAGEYDVDTRRLLNPEAYNQYYCSIANDLGLSERAVSKAVEVLNEIGLIYSETLPREKVNGKWVTNTTVFCNKYKRQGGYLLEDGELYCRREVENKKRLLSSCKRRSV